MNMVDAVITKEGETTYAELSDGIKLRLPAEKAEKVKDYVGKAVVFGIRPEHIGSHETNPNEKDNYITSEVYIVEQMGNEVFVYFSNGKNQYIELATNISYKNTNNETINAEHQAIGNKAIAFVGTSGVQLGWLASQADMLAEDWVIVE